MVQLNWRDDRGRWSWGEYWILRFFSLVRHFLRRYVKFQRLKWFFLPTRTKTWSELWIPIEISSAVAEQYFVNPGEIPGKFPYAIWLKCLAESSECRTAPKRCFCSTRPWWSVENFSLCRAIIFHLHKDAAKGYTFSLLYSVPLIESNVQEFRFAFSLSRRRRHSFRF